MSVQRSGGIHTFFPIEGMCKESSSDGSMDLEIITLSETADLTAHSVADARKRPRWLKGKFHYYLRKSRTQNTCRLANIFVVFCVSHTFIVQHSFAHHYMYTFTGIHRPAAHACIHTHTLIHTHTQTSIGKV